jgi:hypothetical protein
VRFLASTLLTTTALSVPYCSKPAPPESHPSSGTSIVGEAVEANPTLGAGAGPVADAQRVIATLRPQFRLCYNRGLTKEPSMQGKTDVLVKVAADGQVTSATPSATTGLSDEVTACIAGALEAAHFDSGTSDRTLLVPVRFQQTNP